MQNQCKNGADSEFLTKNQRALLNTLKDGPRQYTEIVAALEKEKIKKRTVNNLLEKMDGETIFRVEVDSKVFYRLNDFPPKIRRFLHLVDEAARSQHAADWQPLVEVKGDILRYYPGVPFKEILKRQRAYLELTRPKLKGIIKTLKDYEGDNL